MPNIDPALADYHAAREAAYLKYDKVQAKAADDYCRIIDAARDARDIALREAKAKYAAANTTPVPQVPQE